MAEIIPHITADSWETNGNTLTVWISDLEMLDISPSPQEGLWVLRCNHVSTGKEIHLGMYGHISDAQGAAKNWLGDDDE
jgi:hypothetical protein